MDDRDLLRYSRHLLLDEIGIEGQQKLLNAKVLVVGCGGLGNAALPYLSASGIGHLIIADHDIVDDTNLQRQIAFTETDVGLNKAEVLKRRLQNLNHRVEVIAINEQLKQEHLLKLMPTIDVVLDCSDNFTTRQTINQVSVATRTPLISAAAVRFEGQIAIFRPDLKDSACYACLFDGDENANDGSCALFGVFSPLLGIMGSSQAAETLKLLVSIGEQTVNQLLLYDALSNRWQRFKFSKAKHCRVCGT